MVVGVNVGKKTRSEKQIWKGGFSGASWKMWQMDWFLHGQEVSSRKQVHDGWKIWWDTYETYVFLSQKKELEGITV